MPDETTTSGADQESTTASAAPESAVATEERIAEEGEEKQPEKLQQEVEIKDVGPCKKHIKVTIDRSSIEKLLDKKFSELIKDAIVPGFRKGKAPRKIVERQFHKDVTEQIRGELLMASLEQLAEDYDIAPITPPNLDPNKIEVPSSGPMIYEFDVEVRPQFDLPNYKGLKLKRPVRQFTEEDIDRELKRLLSRYGQLVPKDGPAELDDYVIVDMTSRFGDKVIGTAKELTLRVDKRLAFKDGVAEDFGAKVVGARAGDTRVIQIKMLDNVANPELAGQTVEATLEIKDVKRMRLPELTHEFLHNFGVHSVGELRDEIEAALKRRLEYLQRQSYRRQILQHIAQTQTWALPEDLLKRQARRALQRRVLEMQEAGMSDEEIEAQVRLMQQDIIASTALSLKEHFVLQKIAEEEKLDVSEDDIEREIEILAEETGESPRRVRARLEKEGQLETLATLIIERKALELILQNAEYEDVPLDKLEGDSVAVTEEQAVEGELRDPTAEAEAAAKAEEAAKAQPSSPEEAGQ